MRRLGLVIVLQINGDWRSKLQKLRGEYQLSCKAIRQVSRYVAQRPLHKQCEAHTTYEEYGPVRVDGGFTIFYTNHHWFPVLWLIRLASGESPESTMLKGEALKQFYVDGCRHYRLVERRGVEVAEAISQEGELIYGHLPAELRVIRRAAMPDNLLREIYSR
jgi:hypothetical protein